MLLFVSNNGFISPGIFRGLIIYSTDMPVLGSCAGLPAVYYISITVIATNKWSGNLISLSPHPWSSSIKSRTRRPRGGSPSLPLASRVTVPDLVVFCITGWLGGSFRKLATISTKQTNWCKTGLKFDWTRVLARQPKLIPVLTLSPFSPFFFLATFFGCV